MAGEHTLKRFDEELERLSSTISEMGGLAETALTQCLVALRQSDSEIAEQVIAADARVDAIEKEIQDHVLQMLALRQPMAVDLRHILSSVKMATTLERIADYAKNNAKRSIVLMQSSVPPRAMTGIDRIGRLVQGLLTDVLDAFSKNDVPAAEAVWKRDEEIDDAYNGLFRELLTYMMEDPRNITFCIHLMFCAKNIERMGDHATNVAETVHYMVEGRPMSDPRPKGDTTTFAKAAAT